MQFSSAVLRLCGLLSLVARLPTASGRLSSASTKGVHADSSPKSLHKILEESMHPPEIETRIVGGLPALTGEFPWYVAPSSGDVLCGASLVHSDVALTAAHCVEAFNPGAGVYVGAYELGEDSGGAVPRTIAEILPHPDYNENTVSHDFMLFKLSSPVTGVTPIELNEDDAVPSLNQPLKIMGFGLKEEDGDFSKELLDVEVYAVGFGTCWFEYLFVANVDEDVMFCTGGGGLKRDSCSGDSGGPVVTSDGKQVGVISFGVGCARSSFSGVNARVSGVIDWIKQGVCDLSSDKPSSWCGGEEEEDDDKPQTQPEGTSQIRLEVTYDFWVDETTFAFSQGGTKIYEGPEYSPGPYEAWTTTFDEFPTGTTTFTIYDSKCDGMSSNQGDGSFAIYRVSGDSETLLASGGGIFECEQAVSFVA